MTNFEREAYNKRTTQYARVKYSIIFLKSTFQKKKFKVVVDKGFKVF
jgi:hypothetical protein